MAGGKGGGRPELAQAGATDPTKLDEADLSASGDPVVAAHVLAATTRLAAQPIADASLAELVGVLEKIAGRKVVPTVETDPELIGGLTVEMQGTVYDGSVRTQLERLARTMAKAD